MVSLLDEAAHLLEQASYDALTVEGKADQYAMFTATWAVKHYIEPRARCEPGWSAADRTSA